MKKIKHSKKKNEKGENWIKNEFILSKSEINKIKRDFFAESLNEKETILVINKMNKDFNILVDPHTAVGIGVMKKTSLEGNNIVLSTAHPAKFSEAVIDATNEKPDLPESLRNILVEKENYDTLPKDLEKIKSYILERI